MVQPIRIPRLLLTGALALALPCLAQLPCFAQQLPAGTHSADDHTRERTAAEKSAEQIEAAEAALDHGEFAKAEGLLKTLAVSHPKDARVQYDLGFAAERNADEPTAAAAYRAAIAADGSMAEPHLALGLLEARGGKDADARAELAVVSQMQNIPPELKARALRAMARLDAASAPSVAADELSRAIQLTGETADDTALSAELAARLGDSADAAAAYRKALAADPGNVDAAVGLATALQHAHKQVEAQAVLTDALAAHPDDARLLTRQAALYADQGQLDKAQPLLEELHGVRPQDEAVTRMLAKAYDLNGASAKAEPLDRALVAAHPDDPQLLDDLGGVLVKQMKYDEAEADFRKAVAMRAAFHDDKAWAECAGHLAFAASRAHHPELSLQALAARATVLANSPSSLFLEAIAHDALRQNKEAVMAYRAFLAAAAGKYPDEEFEARHRLIALEHQK